MPWLTEQLLEEPELLIGSSAEFACFAATLVKKHAQKTASMGNEFWSAHGEGRHKFLSGGALCSINATDSPQDTWTASRARGQPQVGGPGFAGYLPYKQ